MDPPTSTRQLAERTEKFILVEESRIRLLGGGTSTPTPQAPSGTRNNTPSGGKGSARSRLGGRQDNPNTQQQVATNSLPPEVNVIFNTPLPQILQEVRHQRYFLPPRPMASDPSTR